MIETSLNFLEKTIIPIGGWGVFLASILEEVIAPIPSPLVMMSAGFLFVSGPINVASITTLLIKVVIPASVGVTIGSLVIFYAAWFGGKIVVDRFGKYLGLSWDDIEKLDGAMSGSRKDEAIIFIARIIPVVPSVAIAAFCGFVRMQLGKYLMLTFFGTLFRSLILGTIGWQVGNIYYQYADLVSKIEHYVVYAMAVSVIALIIWLHRRSRRGVKVI